jgi:hypothetical protein
LIFLSTDEGLLKNVQDAVSLNEYRHFLRAVEDLRRESTAKNESSGRAAPKRSQYDTATRTERMEKEIRDLEQESYYKDTSSKAQCKKDRQIVTSRTLKTMQIN